MKHLLKIQNASTVCVSSPLFLLPLTLIIPKTNLLLSTQFPLKKSLSGRIIIEKRFVRINVGMCLLARSFSSSTNRGKVVLPWDSRLPWKRYIGCFDFKRSDDEFILNCDILHTLGC
jgi:hypothetical protein